MSVKPGDERTGWAAHDLPNLYGEDDPIWVVGTDRAGAIKLVVDYVGFDYDEQPEQVYVRPWTPEECSAGLSDVGIHECDPDHPDARLAWRF